MKVKADHGAPICRYLFKINEMIPVCQLSGSTERSLKSKFLFTLYMYFGRFAFNMRMTLAAIFDGGILRASTLSTIFLNLAALQE